MVLQNGNGAANDGLVQDAVGGYIAQRVVLLVGRHGADDGCSRVRPSLHKEAVLLLPTECTSSPTEMRYGTRGLPMCQECKRRTTVLYTIYDGRIVCTWCKLEIEDFYSLDLWAWECMFGSESGPAVA